MTTNQRQRSTEFARNASLEQLITELNSILEKAELEAVQAFVHPKYPPLFIVGCPRSGTTLLLQWLAASGAFGYPSNLISRFYKSPYIGAKIQQMLTDPAYQFRDEMDGIESSESYLYRSELGKTRGFLSPNEFWYFWRRFFRFQNTHRLNEEELRKVNAEELQQEIAALESVFDKPLVMKAMILNWNLSYLAQVFPDAIFLYIQRHPYFTIQSLLTARIKHSGRIDVWYSFKPPEYESIKNLDPYRQVAGQVYYTTRGVENELRKISKKNQIWVTYEKFCQEPNALWDKLIEIYTQKGYLLPPYRGQKQFPNSNKIYLSEEDVQKIVHAYRELTGENISPESLLGQEKRTVGL
ncbi:MAG: sulfotransferase [Calditrichaeota bacterium]|nr:MAG: sulfotransferase [Calditrichota bacterium]